MQPDQPSFLTRTGIPLTIRPIEADDREALHRAFLRLSGESRYRRFLGPIADLEPDTLTRLTEVDHRGHEAFVAFDADGELVGVARYIRQDEPDSAEVAVTVADEWQGQGVGTELLGRLTKRAQEEGIEAFTATCLMDNSGMLDVFRALPGATCTVTEPLGGVVEVRLALGPAGEDLAKVIRVGSGAFAGIHHPAVPR